MKTKILKLLSSFLPLLFLSTMLLGAGCEKEDETINIEPIIPASSIETQLNTIFSNDNRCLIGFQQDSICIFFYSQEELNETDTCNGIPVIDFNGYSLIAGKVMVPGMVSKISGVTLTYSNLEDRYKLEVFVDECKECYDAIGYLFFWRLYPKLREENNFDLIISKN